MKARIDELQTRIILEQKEVEELCKPGCGKDTCIWLLLGANGFECSMINPDPTLKKRFLDGLTVTKRDGCENMENFIAYSKLENNKSYFYYDLINNKIVE